MRNLFNDLRCNYILTYRINFFVSMQKCKCRDQTSVKARFAGARGFQYLRS